MIFLTRLDTVAPVRLRPLGAPPLTDDTRQLLADRRRALLPGGQREPRSCGDKPAMPRSCVEGPGGSPAKRAGQGRVGRRLARAASSHRQRGGRDAQRNPSAQRLLRQHRSCHCCQRPEISDTGASAAITGDDQHLQATANRYRHTVSDFGGNEAIHCHRNRQDPRGHVQALLLGHETRPS